jgi:hypothetical protein
MLNAKPDWPNFTVALFYVDGPADYIKVIYEGREYTVPYGKGIGWYVEPCPNPPFTLSVEGDVVFSKEGYYTFQGLSGFIKDTTFYFDDRTEKSITVKFAPGWLDWLKQNWVPVTIVAGTVGTLAAVGAVAVREIKKK